MDAEPRIAVIGGGISGLAAAHRLGELAEERGLRLAVSLVEAAGAVGGQIRTEEIDGTIFEGGPDTLVLSKPAGRSLCERIGLAGELVPVSRDRPGVQILHRGRLHALPEGFVMMAPTRLGPALRSSLFSVRGKVRMGLERFLPRRPPAGGDESLASFVRRRFGSEVLDRVAEPILASLFTADAERLSLATTMPRFLEMERRHGSVTRAFAEASRQTREGLASGRHAVVYSDVAYVRSGFGRIVDVLLSRLPSGCVATGARAEEIVQPTRGRGFEVRIHGRGALRADAVVLTTPAHAAAPLLRSTDANLAGDLAGLSYASCATVNLLYRADDLGRPLESFGFFVPRTERRRLLACSFVSVKFEGRAPRDRVLLRAFLGGALHADVLDLDDDALARLAHEELRTILDLRREPLRSRTHRFTRAMPQYEVGFAGRLASIASRAREMPGLFFAGSVVGAVGVPDCVASGETAALAALEHIGARAAQERASSGGPHPAGDPAHALP